MNLDILRKEIDKTDSKLIESIANRLKLVKEIGEYKKANNLSLRDEEREQKVLQYWKNKFSSLGLNDDLFIKKLFELVIEESVKSQEGIIHK